MNRLLALAVFCMLPLAALADWRDQLTPPKPGAFPLPPPMRAKYRFGWGAFTAAEGDFEWSRPQKGQLQLQVSTKTTGAVRSMWRMDGRHTARCDATTLRPISLQQTETYQDETSKTTADFSPEGVVRRSESVPAGASPAKPKRFKCPNLFDIQTALLFVRSQALKPGDVYRLIVYPSKTPYLATVRVVGLEKIKVGGKEYPAVKMDLALDWVTKELQLAPHRKFKKASAWLSDDRDRLLLKIESEVFVGSVWAELESIDAEPPEKRAASARK